MSGYLVDKRQGLGLYLERIPFNGSYEFLAMGPQHATVFTKARAEQLARERGGVVVPDVYYQREPKETA